MCGILAILGIDPEAGSLTFAGDIPQGTYARLMKANFERLIDGAAGAARICHEALQGMDPDFAVLISCVGRKLVMGGDVEDEVAAVREVFGPAAVLTGFYSYGEIAAFDALNRRPCLHNQTMTITRIG